MPVTSAELLAMDPVPTLLARVRAELSADFAPGNPVRVSRAPGRLDVMGGIADYTGSMVCEMPLDRAAAVALQVRDDRQVQVFSFNLLDEHKPFTLRIPLDAIANVDAPTLRREFAQPGRGWAAYLVGCLFVLHQRKLIDLSDPRHAGVNLALYSTVPAGAGVSSSAALEVATMMNLVDHFGIGRDLVDGLTLAAMCQQVEHQIVGAPCGIMDQVASCLGEAGTLLRMVCQPHELLPPLKLPQGVRVVGINSGIRHSVAGGAYGHTRCAAFMGHRMILERMRHFGQLAGRELAGDPMNGYLANLDPDDYKRLFRRHLPESLPGREFLDRYTSTIDTATQVDPDTTYAVQRAVDHHVLEARRVRRFVEFIEQAASTSAALRVRGAGAPLDRAGHLMYASHISYTNDALLGAPECDLLVDLVRKREHAGLYGAKITGGGSGGTVAVLCDAGERADAGIAEVFGEYAQRTGHAAEVLSGSSAGAWHCGTVIVSDAAAGR